MKSVILYVGYGTIITFCILVIIGILYMIKYLVKDFIRRYKYKHIFNKLPIAECYCKDCRYKWGEKCEKLDRNVPDNGFCYLSKYMEDKDI